MLLSLMYWNSTHRITKTNKLRQKKNKQTIESNNYYIFLIYSFYFFFYYSTNAINTLINDTLTFFR